MPLFLFTDMYDHTDPTAWIAIANVERERKRAEQNANKPKPIENPVKDPCGPVDWKKVLASPNKKIRINKAWLFYSSVKKNIDELRKREMEG